MTSTTSTSKANNNKEPSAALSAPSTTDLSFLGAPPLIPGEAASDYQQLLAAVTNELKPVDFMETIWARDIVDLQWDIIRFRHIKADLITFRYERSNAHLAASEMNFKRILKTTLKGDIANIVAVNIDALERIDRLVMTMEARRNAAYREAERHRIGLGERLRRATEQVEDAEFREVDDAPSEQERAA
jgi:hypothetical protein